MTERKDLIQRMEELEFQRVAAMEKELRLHAEFMDTAWGSKEEQAKARELEEVCSELEKVRGELDSLSDKIGAIAAQLHPIEGAESRKAMLWDAASLYGRVL
jgi:chromosome segregation ATPase